MYTSFYKLNKKPFTVNPDLSFLWLGEKHEEAFATLRYGILENKGFLFLTGDVGSGKTMLIKALTDKLDEDILWAVITDPQLERIDFYNAIAKGFSLGTSFTSKVQFLIQFSSFLHKAEEEKKKVLLLVDDCHLLSQEMLEELRLLSNIEKEHTKLINIFFVGQHEFNDMLHEPKNRGVKQRLTLTAEVPALTAEETDAYIRHRLKVAGTEEEVFTAKAIQAVYMKSRGIPRQINALCNHALITGFLRTSKIIDDKMIAASIREMGLPANSLLEDSFSPEPAPNKTSFSEFFLKNYKRYRWEMYGIGLLWIVVVGIYFGLSALHSGESARKVPVAIARVPVVEHVSQPQVGSPPAVAMLEEKQKIKKLLTEEKAAEMNSSGGVEHPAEVPAVVPQSEIPEKPAAAPAPSVPPVPPFEPRKIVIALQPNGLHLTGEAAKEFDGFVAKLKHYPQTTIKVKGFVSTRSNSMKNIKISKERAMSVQKLLLVKGIGAERIEVVGMGNQEPIASNKTNEGRRKNRRVEIVIIDDGISGSGGN